VVLQPNPRGSGGFGEEFRRAAAGDWGRGPFADVLAGVDHVVAMGFVDPDRLGVAGWSYGGYLTAWAIGQTDRFAAASVGAGVFDLESHFGQAREQMVEYFGGPPWEIPEAYERDSPSSYVGSIVTPTQVIHGDADWAVAFAQGQQLVASLATIDVPHEFLAYPGQGHTIADPEMQDEAWERVLAWFDRWLRDGASRP
jgi:dipeptidyl aminopeptidase/acylaminoacyl peptidase